MILERQRTSQDDPGLGFADLEESKSTSLQRQKTNPDGVTSSFDEVARRKSMILERQRTSQDDPGLGFADLEESKSTSLQRQKTNPDEVTSSFDEVARRK